MDLLISSNIARYAEFRCVTRILTWFRNKLELVPCSRADVFSTKEVSVVEKRLLMQLLQLCAEYKQDGKEFEGFYLYQVQKKKCNVIGPEEQESKIFRKMGSRLETDIF